jgi:hypothetical protein
MWQAGLTGVVSSCPFLPYPDSHFDLSVASNVSPDSYSYYHSCPFCDRRRPCGTVLPRDRRHPCLSFDVGRMMRARPGLGLDDDRPSGIDRLSLRSVMTWSSVQLFGW